MALEHHIAMWDTLAACEIKEQESSIRNPEPNRSQWLIAQTQVESGFSAQERHLEVLHQAASAESAVCLP